MAAEGNGITLTNDANGSYHFIGALTCRQMTTAYVLEAIALLKEMHLSLLLKHSKLTPSYVLILRNRLKTYSRAIILYSQRNYKWLSTGPKSKPERVTKAPLI